MSTANWTEVRLYKMVYRLTRDVLATKGRSTKPAPDASADRQDRDRERLTYEVAGRLRLAEVDETVRTAVGDALARRGPRW